MNVQCPIETLMFYRSALVPGKLYRVIHDHRRVPGQQPFRLQILMREGHRPVYNRGYNNAAHALDHLLRRITDHNLGGNNGS